MELRAIQLSAISYQLSAISMMTCLLALVCSIIGSIELYLVIQKSMESDNDKGNKEIE